MKGIRSRWAVVPSPATLKPHVAGQEPQDVSQNVLHRKYFPRAASTRNGAFSKRQPAYLSPPHARDHGEGAAVSLLPCVSGLLLSDLGLRLRDKARHRHYFARLVWQRKQMRLYVYRRSVQMPSYLPKYSTVRTILDFSKLVIKFSFFTFLLGSF